VILCHAGTPVGWAGPFSQTGHSEPERADIDRSWRAGLTRLAELPNVTVKLSGLTMPVVGFSYHERESQPTAVELAESLRPLVRFVIDTFGSERCMFASNFPVDKVSNTWADLFAAYDAITADFSEPERARLFRENAERIYRLTVT